MPEFDLTQVMELTEQVVVTVPKVLPTGKYARDKDNKLLPGKTFIVREGARTWLVVEGEKHPLKVKSGSHGQKLRDMFTVSGTITSSQITEEIYGGRETKMAPTKIIRDVNELLVPRVKCLLRRHMPSGLTRLVLGKGGTYLCRLPVRVPDQVDGWV